MIPESSVLAECVLLRGRCENDSSGHHHVETAVVGNGLSSVFHRKTQSRNGLPVAAGEDLAGWDMASAPAEVRPEAC